MKRFTLLLIGILGISESWAASLPTDVEMLNKWCKEVGQAVQSLHWKVDPCGGKINWHVGGQSVNGRPLVYAEFGDPTATNSTLVLSTVHGDEITPLYIGLKLALWIKERQDQLGKTKVVIAPLVNPDGFLSHPRKRTNAHGVDVNRNFDTKDFKTRALMAWKKKYRSDPRRFPGFEAKSEPETQFQEQLIERINPQKILSIHSPLNFTDYDGPSHITLSQFPTEYTRECARLRKQLKAIYGGDYEGSLGKRAGRELGIPTVTLELPSTDPKKAENYWQHFSHGIRTMIQFNLPTLASGATEPQSGG